MVKRHVIPTTAGEEQTRRQIILELDRWNRDAREEGEVVTNYDFPIDSKIGGGKGVLRFVLRGQNIVIECESQPDYRRNIRAVFYALESMRKNEKRGIADTIRRAYLQIEAPVTQRDPYEVLGVRPETSLEDIKVMFRQKAKRLHSDVGGNDEQMKDLNMAWETIQEEKS